MTTGHMQVTSGTDVLSSEVIHLTLYTGVTKEPEMGAQPQIPYNPSLHLAPGR